MLFYSVSYYQPCMPPRGGMAFGVTESAEASAVPHLFFPPLTTMHAASPRGKRWHLVLRSVQRQVQCCSAAVRNFFLCGHLVAMENA